MQEFEQILAHLALLVTASHLCGVLGLRLEIEPAYCQIRGVGQDPWMHHYQGQVDQVGLLEDLSGVFGGQALLGGGAQPDLSGIFGGLLAPKRPVLNGSVPAPPGSGIAQVLCSAAGSVLASCEFRLQREADAPVLIDMSLGSNSPPQTIQIEDTTIAVSYHGRGLAAGDCGLSLTNVRHGGYKIGCRARKVTGKWAYGFSILDANGMLTPYRGQVLRGARRVVARVGTSVTMLVTAPGIAFQSCLAVPSRLGVAVLMFQGPLSPSFGNYRYHGGGLPQGECGVQVLDVEPVDAGPMYLGASVFTQLVVDAPLLLVEHGPEQPPQLSLQDGQLFAEGDTLEATCTALPAFPAATLSWSFAGRTLRAASDTDDSDPLGALWRWPWEARSVTQTLTLRRKLTLLDDGAELVCIQRHPAASSKETRLKIAVDLKVVSQDCGLRAPTRAKRVTHGSAARPGQFPWHVCVYYRTTAAAKFEFRCGGTLVSDKIVVTAAHCTVLTGKAIDLRGVPIAASNLRVTLGSTLAEWQADSAEYVQQRLVAEVHRHANFESSVQNLHFDLALLRLSMRVRTSEHVAPACLAWRPSGAGAGVPGVGSIGEVAGWGATHDAPRSPTLHWVRLPVASRPQCTEALRGSDFSNFLTSDKFCAGTVGGDTGTCKGDSGGGLMFPKTDDQGIERFFLRGVVSVAFAKQQTGMPCVAQTFAGFTDISHYTTWIEKFLREDRLRWLKRQTLQQSRKQAIVFPS